jgi:hypothetical protein
VAGDQHQVQIQAEGCQKRRRTRDGIDLVDKVSRTIRDLTIAFDIEPSKIGP